MKLTKYFMQLLVKGTFIIFSVLYCLWPELAHHEPEKEIRQTEWHVANFV